MTIQIRTSLENCICVWTRQRPRGPVLHTVSCLRIYVALTTPKEEFQQKIEDRGWVAVCDPTCGAGALLVAFANQCKREDINYQQKILFVAQDIDYIVGMMCYLQMSLLGMPGYVVIGDTLANPVLSYDSRGLLPIDNGNIWYTPLLRTAVWQYRILAARDGPYDKADKNQERAGHAKIRTTESS